MPSRLLREGILDSEAVNKLTPAEEVFYRRLMSVVDDYGRFDGRPSVLRSRLYSLRIDGVKESAIVGWLDACERVGLVARYSSGGKPYILLGKLGSPRSKGSKFPDPPADVEERLQTHSDVNGCNLSHGDKLYNADSQLTSVNGCKQMKTDVPGSGSGSGSIYVDGFASFWKAYPKKAEKPKAEAAYREVVKSPETIESVFTGLEKWKCSDKWTKDAGQFIPHPAKFLKQKHWQDDAGPVHLTAANRTTDCPNGTIPESHRRLAPPLADLDIPKGNQ